MRRIRRAALFAAPVAPCRCDPHRPGRGHRGVQGDPRARGHPDEHALRDRRRHAAGADGRGEARVDGPGRAARGGHGWPTVPWFRAAPKRLHPRIPAPRQGPRVPGCASPCPGVTSPTAHWTAHSRTAIPRSRQNHGFSAELAGGRWWAVQDSNLRLRPCDDRTLPTELTARPIARPTGGRGTPSRRGARTLAKRASACQASITRVRPAARRSGPVAASAWWRGVRRGGTQ